MQFQNMPNFRAISLDGEQQVGEKCKHKLYRASRPDFLTEREVEMFIEQLGIKSIVDFRSPKEYARSQAARLLDHHYGLHKVIVPSRFNNTDQVKWKPASPQTDVKEKRHYFINFFKFIYFRKIFKLAPWYFRLYSLLFLLVDFILDNGFKYFVRQFSKAVLNNMGLIGQYQYMIDYSQPSICSGLSRYLFKSQIWLKVRIRLLYITFYRFILTANHRILSPYMPKFYKNITLDGRQAT